MKTLVFDADGVVVVPPHQFMAYLRDELGVISDYSREFFDGIFQECLVGRADMKAEIASFLPRWGWEGTVEGFLRLWFEKDHHLNDPLVDVIGALRQQGYRCVVATNQERYRLAYMRDQMGLSQVFDRIIGSADVGAVKPKAEFYQRVTECLDTAPDQVVFWTPEQKHANGPCHYEVSFHMVTTMRVCLWILRHGG